MVFAFLPTFHFASALSVRYALLPAKSGLKRPVSALSGHGMFAALDHAHA
jgi:hypothetical protein